MTVEQIAKADPFFHTHDGITFQRSFGGWVEIHQGGTYLFSFDPATWASVVTFVSALNSGGRYRSALAFHQGRDHFDPNDNSGEIHAPEVVLGAALEVAASRFRFLATTQREAGRPESKGNAAILERYAEECDTALRTKESDSGRD